MALLINVSGEIAHLQFMSLTCRQIHRDPASILICKVSKQLVFKFSLGLYFSTVKKAQSFADKKGTEDKERSSFVTCENRTQPGMLNRNCRGTT